MLGLELWFVLALSSTLAGGIAAFVYKVASVHHVNGTLVASYSGFVSALIMSVFFIYQGDYSHLWHPMVIFAALASATFFMTQLLKIEGMKHIDTAIFYPIYKVIGPLGAILIGLVFFGEQFTNLELVGLGLSVLVRIMLITKAEHARQNGLIKGLWLVSLCAIISAVSISLTKEGADVAVNIWGYILMGEFFMGLTGVILLLFKFKTRSLSVVRNETNSKVIQLSVLLGLMHALGAYTMVFAFYHQGPLAIVYTINSLYILIPIILSIIIYKEHWNARKVVAIILSIAALALLA